MTLDWHQHRFGLMVGRTKHNWNAAFSQLDKYRVAPRDAMSVDEDGSNLIERDKTYGLPLLVYLQKPTITRDVATILADINYLVQRKSPMQNLTSNKVYRQSGIYEALLRLSRIVQSTHLIDHNPTCIRSHQRGSLHPNV